MVYLYQYRPDLYKVVEMYDNKLGALDMRPGETDPEAVKTSDNIRRAHRTIEELALCNDFPWFGTFTLSPEKYDRLDLKKFRKDFTQFLRDLKRKTGIKIEYLLVPELHHNRQGWHMHGLFRGITEDQLRLFTLKERLPTYLRDKLKHGALIFDWPAYRDKFGWVDMEPVRSRDAAARYITKYLTKDATTPEEIALHDHLYYCSQGLQRSELIYLTPSALTDEKGKAASSILAALPSGGRFEYSSEFEYGRVLWYSTRDKCSPADILCQENLRP